MRDTTLHRSILPSIVLALGLGSIASAAELVPDWTRRWASAEDKRDEAADVVTDAAGNIYVTGSSGFFALTTWDIVTASYAPDGSERWVTVYDGGSQDVAKAATLDASADLLVLGRSNGNFLVLRYDTASGAQLAAYEHDAGGIDDPNAFSNDAAGNIYITGASWPDGVDNQNDYYTVKLDPLGTAQWSARYNGTGSFLFAHDVAHDIGLDGAGDVFVTGYSNAPGSASGDFYTIKYDGGDGHELWADRYSAGPNEVAYDLEIDAAGRVYVTGGSYQSGFKFVTIRYANTDGTREWVATDAPAVCSVATELELDGAGDVYITGWADPDCDESNFNEDIATIKHRAADGAVVWSALFGDPGVGHFDVPHDLVIDAAGNVYVTGENTGLLVLLEYEPQTGNQLGIDTIQTGPLEIASGQALALDAAQGVVVAGRARNYNTEDRDFYTVKYPGAGEGPMVFTEGFESGGTGAWSTTMP